MSATRFGKWRYSVPEPRPAAWAMSSRGAFGPNVANASRAAATRSSTLRRASARRARTAGREAVRLSIDSDFMGDLINGDSPRIVTSYQPERSPGYLPILAPRHNAGHAQPAIRGPPTEGVI